MMRRVHKLFYLPANEQRLLVRALILLWAIRLGQWLLPFQTLRRIIAHLIHAPDRRDIIGSSSQEKISWAITAVSRYVFKPTCLTQALALQVLFQKEGYDATLHIGVTRNNEGQLQAHAWLESQGNVIIGGAELDRYTHLLALESEKK